MSLALSEAITIFRADLTPEEGVAFENADHSLTDKSILYKLKDADEQRADRYMLLKSAENVESTFSVLKRLADVISLATSANPIATIVLDTVKIVFDVALGLLTYFNKLSEMISQFAGVVEALTHWPETAGHVNHLPLHNARVRVYGDFLCFCHRAYGVHVDRRGQTRKWTTISASVRVQGKPFEAQYAAGVLQIKNHLTELNLASFGALLNAVADAQKYREGMIGPSIHALQNNLD